MATSYVRTGGWPRIPDLPISYTNPRAVRRFVADICARPRALNASQNSDITRSSPDADTAQTIPAVSMAQVKGACNSSVQRHTTRTLLGPIDRSKLP
jgi:hypothetical protein